VQRKDLIEIMLPFFENDLKTLEEEVEVVVMKKGRMRGQAFWNFKSLEKAVELKERLNGYVVGVKPLVIEFSRGG